MRLVSLLPSATEIVYALGLGDDLVGVSFECDEPPSARHDKRIVVGGRDTRALTPREIDDYVRAQLASGGELYTLHADALADLAPDVILTQDLCRVCALPTGKVEDALDHLGCQADVVSLDPYSLDDVLESIRIVGVRTGVPGRADVLVRDLRSRLDAVSAAVATEAPVRVALVEWIDPPFSAGHWIPDLIRAAGGVAVAASPAGKSVETSWAEIVAAEPDVVVVAPCGYHLGGAVDQAAVVADQIADVPIWAIDADGIVVRPGPRIVQGVEALAAILHPNLVPAPRPGAIARVR
jgi:iron complex transport system substrate-binding protein